MPKGSSLDLVVDTGFNGELCLPLSLLKKHGFVWRAIRKVELADGSRVDSDLYEGQILWFGKRRKVTALSTRSASGLLGTEMLILIPVHCVTLSEAKGLSGKILRCAQNDTMQ